VENTVNNSNPFVIEPALALVLNVKSPAGTTVSIKFFENTPEHAAMIALHRANPKNFARLIEDQFNAMGQEQH
jgi:hypothetical protein